MKPLVLMKTDTGVACDVVAAPTNEDCRSLTKYFEKYWSAGVEEVYDTGFASRFHLSIPGRPVLRLDHDSQTGNTIAVRDGGDVEDVASDVLADLNSRLSE